MHKKLLFILSVALVASMSLAGCAAEGANGDRPIMYNDNSENPPNEPSVHGSFIQIQPDGTGLQCSWAALSTDYRSSISYTCNWEAYNLANANE